MKNIALATIYTKMNYGTVLQAFATQKVLDELGYDNYTIDCRGIDEKNKKVRYFYFFSHALSKGMIKNKIGFLIKKILLKINYKQLKEREEIRRRLFDEFIAENIRFCPAFCDMEKLAKYTEQNACAVIVGSDQIWQPQHILAGYYTLQWVPKKIKRISLATSFGYDSLETSIGKKAGDFLEQFDAISVREKSGVRIVDELCGKDATLLCDPTMMVDTEFWNEFVCDKRICDEKYILCYFLGKNKECREVAKRIKEETGYRIVALIHMDEYIPMDERYADETPFNVGPAEFLNYIKNAEMVLTDSFHGTIFSIVFEKDFWVFNRFSRSEMSTNGRITTLLSKVALDERLFTDKSSVDIYKVIDYSLIRANIKRCRDEARCYIRNAVES